MTPRTVIKYPGAKWSVAQWIVSVIPPHKSYLEPFFGSGAVFFTKPPSRIETINDLDGEIVNLFTVIRDRPEELERAVALTPYSREEYDEAWIALRAQAPADPVEAARRTLVRYWQTHGSRSLYKGGWKNDRAGREYAYAARYWNRLPAWIAESVGRLKEAQIEHVPAVECIRRFRSPEVLIYADPPYLLSTRKQRQYRVEMEGEDQHRELLKVLLDHPGPVMLSGYDNELYNDTLPGWMKLRHKAMCEYGGKRTEVLWVNFEPQESLL
jgi:DNA adenine methylase